MTTQQIKMVKPDGATVQVNVAQNMQVFSEENK